MRNRIQHGMKFASSAAWKFAALLIVSSLPAVSQTSAGTTATDTAKTTSAATAAPANATAQSAAPAKSTASTQTLPQQIASLPTLANPGIDTAAQGKAILEHLNDVLRFYRASTTQIQKVGEPSDALYGEQASQHAAQIGQTAFQSARNLAALFNRLQPGNTPSGGSQPAEDADSDDAQPQEPTTAQRLTAARARVQARIADLSAQDAALDKQISTAKGKALAPLQQRDEQLEGQLELQKAMLDAMTRVSSMADAQTATGLVGDVERLLRAAPELASATRPVAAPPVLESLSAVRDSGVSTQAIALFQLLGARKDIDNRIHDLDALKKQATDLRAPLLSLLRSTIQQGNAAMQAPANLSDAEALRATRKHYDTLSSTFRVLSTATLPSSQEVLLLESARANLTAWRTVVNAEYSTLLRALLVRVVSIAVALLVLFIVSGIWQRLTVKYVRDIRRRRQILIIRRIVLGFLTGMVLIFGFVTQFSSLATFAGFITAGIAVGLQTILLSVAAYFFIVGRYGVRVGDRITVAGVTGDVIEVGLVRFYMSELTGTGTEFHPTGRVAVFANSVLFQSGTPLYKQMPGTEYAWHELTVKLKPNADYRAATDVILRAVTNTYNTYRAAIEAQHQSVEQWMDAAVEQPGIEPRLQLTDAGLQYAVLFPVEIKNASSTDEAMIHALLHDMENNEAVKNAILAPPQVKAVVKG
ncbi:mechanosensitive ion channel family protein [Terriglobus roseus]|uniref:Small-conductance mechanosensitive channel n=1 Tax=Terriglobus roseus TaxID=392734 RepID=A0A1G7KIR8_9BACT|nr:mechanosensitive ion channel family protein [Terriglobus roseus]SDF37035.1 Small-conductance mechanosensitive channel [Terriglobus roseus]